MVNAEIDVEYSSPYETQADVQSLLEVARLSVYYHVRYNTQRQALHHVNFRIQPGEVVGVLGESGSGKTTLALAVARLLPPNAWVEDGSVEYRGCNVLRAGEDEMRSIRGAQVAFMFQEPAAALNPVDSVGDQVAELLRTHRGYHRELRRKVAEDILSEAGLPDPKLTYHAYPHELSGVQRQRVAIGQALACRPELLIADEPTSGLDIEARADVLRCLKDVKTRLNTAILMLTHDPFTLAGLADRVLILREGELREGNLAQVLERPARLFERGLVRALIATTTTRAEPAPPLKHEGTPLRKQAECAPVPAQPERVPVLVARDVCKTYGKRSWFTVSRAPMMRALKGVSLELRAGTMTGLVGESGSGKSTLARCLAGLEKPDSGEICLEGCDLLRLPSPEMRKSRRRIQLVAQNSAAAFNPGLTLEEMVAEPLKLRGVPLAEQHDRASALMKQVGLSGSALGRRSHELSGEHRQRLAIARALAADPAILILDDALSGLNLPAQARISELLLRLQESLSLTYLFITDDLRLAGYVTDDIIVMRSGRILEQASTLDIFTNPRCVRTHSMVSTVTQFDD